MDWLIDTVMGLLGRTEVNEVEEEEEVLPAIPDTFLDPEGQRAIPSEAGDIARKRIEKRAKDIFPNSEEHRKLYTMLSMFEQMPTYLSGRQLEEAHIDGERYFRPVNVARGYASMEPQTAANLLLSALINAGVPENYETVQAVLEPLLTEEGEDPYMVGTTPIRSVEDLINNRTTLGLSRTAQGRALAENIVKDFLDKKESGATRQEREEGRGDYERIFRQQQFRDLTSGLTGPSFAAAGGQDKLDTIREFVTTPDPDFVGPYEPTQLEAVERLLKKRRAGGEMTAQDLVDMEEARQTFINFNRPSHRPTAAQLIESKRFYYPEEEEE